MIEQFQISITSFLKTFGDSLMMQAALVIMISFVVASIFKYIFIAGLRWLISRSRISVANGFLDLLHGPIYYSVLLIGLTSALFVLTTDTLYLFIGTSILLSVGMLIWTSFLLRGNRQLLRSLMLHPTRFKSINHKTLPLFQNVINIVIIVLAVYLIFSIWKVDMTAWLASAGIIGIAVGFAAKDTLANLFSGVFIIADAPYKVGDYVVLDSGERGEITHIGIRSTRMLTRDDVEITIPNSVMGNSKIINESGGPHEKSRCRVPIGVSYETDIDLVRDLLMAIALSEESVCTEPEPRVRFRRFSGSALDFELLVWIDKPELKGRIIDILNCEILKKFRENNIEIPYSKHDLYIKQMPQEK
ncbi:mechanosensitive ion channel family protein [Aliiglaciecola sp. M165]|uniref:mechanosensitive ion channel family protein n=1 Tax=Aliiglaciecola sp. M165 TaxID=2593649 RepID=UPI00117FA378|nr:mechanosensitive ion channel family protein [Aliiglaciecola sp. M165]TRY33865.1 mechanosensitive ion channel family protein [Aliiglaciecola sp. M165]